MHLAALSGGPASRLELSPTCLSRQQSVTIHPAAPIGPTGRDQRDVAGAMAYLPSAMLNDQAGRSSIYGQEVLANPVGECMRTAGFRLSNIQPFGPTRPSAGPSYKGCSRPRGAVER
jgi:hypothetical protein